MPKIPTFTAKGSIEQLAGTTSNIQMGLNNTLASALAPVTKAVVDFKVKENALQNQTEALRLGNDYTTDMLSVTETIENATDSEGKPLYATNQEAANKYLKEQSDFYIKKYSALATNTAVKNKFTNSALSQTRKSIFQTNSYVSQQIVASLNNEYSKAKENLIITSRTDQSGIARGTLKDDLTKLALDTFRDQVSPVELNILIESIPAEIQMYDGLRDVREYPKRTYQLLKDKKYLPALSSDQREKIINQAEAILRPQLTAEYNNYLKYVADGKTPPKFDWELVQQVMPVKVAEQMMMNKTVTEGMVDDVKFLSTLPIVELDQTVSNLIKTAYDSYPFEVAQKKEKYLMDVVSKQKAELESNPAGFVLRTDQEAQDKAEELAAMESDGASFTAPNQYDPSALEQTQLEFVELLLDKQEKLGVKNKKVMTSNMSKQFVEQYLEAGKNSDKKKMNDMINSLVTSYGDNEGLALMQLSADGLPFGAEVYGVLKNSELANIGLSFDTKAEKDAIKKELKVNDINFDDMEKEINEGIKPFLNIVAANTPFNSSESNPQTNKIRTFLTFVASQKLIGNPEMDQSQAVEYAVEAWNNNFVLADTYYVNKQQGDEKFDEEQIGRYNDKLDFIKNFLLDEMNIVSFKSNTETDPVKLSAKMYSQMLTNGEWRNAADGEGEVFGIVLDGSFAPVLNEKGEQITSIITDKSNFIPGTNIVIDYDKPFENDPEDSVNNLINIYEQASELAREKGIPYEEALKEIEKEKPIIPNIEFDDGKKNLEISVNDQSSMLQFDENSQPQFASLDNITGNLNFVRKIWSKYYQTGGKNNSNLKKEGNALSKLILPYTVPEDALNSINKVSNIFQNQKITDGRLSKEIIVDYLSKIGQIETQYNPEKIKQSGNYIEETKFLARSYWQVEPRSARSLIQENFNITKQNKEPLFGPKFEKTFRKSYPKGDSVLQYLSTLSEKQLVPILENDMDLAATFAAADLITKLMRPDSIDI
jgi:hypothetical protein